MSFVHDFIRLKALVWTDSPVGTQQETVLIQCRRAPVNERVVGLVDALDTVEVEARSMVEGEHTRRTCSGSSSGDALGVLVYITLLRTVAPPPSNIVPLAIHSGRAPRSISNITCDTSLVGFPHKIEREYALLALIRTRASPALRRILVILLTL